MRSAPDEYGLYANVNPDVSPPRWSQATERRIGEMTRRKTLLFNGYADQAARLYAGMDLSSVSKEHRENSARPYRNQKNVCSNLGQTQDFCAARLHRAPIGV